MLRRAEKAERKKILEFIRMDITKGVYLYIDIFHYGVNSSEIEVWVAEEAGKYLLVAMKYYESMQIFSLDHKWDMETCLQLIGNEKILMISGDYTLIQQLYQAEAQAGLYDLSEGYVFHINNYRKFSFNEKIELGKKEDMQECAQLICIDEVFASNYTISGLQKQLEDRIDCGMGRNFVIRDQGKIIAHIATYAEGDHIAVTSGLVVHPKYRNRSYGVLIESYLINQLREEGYEVYTFVVEKKRAKLLEAMGAKLCGKYGKLNKRR